ncbi:TLC domain-containing protein 3A-like [Notolabrus celidotus]|uniref:TLC domain-containing protein 3A-like n=1 Tax=Notolabrus celidotus TaxID=1203425 RepID=UPI00148F59BC|nr:TLC domain-containing protein 3A-like [Notolabrus celidotus]
MLSAVACGAVLFPGLFYTSRRLLRRSFTNWSDADVVSVSERLVSAIHASLATAAGVRVVTTCRDVMTDSHWLTDWFTLFGAPYMAYDILAMYLSHYHTQRVRGQSSSYSGHSAHTVKAFLRKDWMLVLHHLVLLLIFLPITLFFRRGLGDFFIGCLFTTEFSTPFVSIGKILIQLGLDDTRLHRINGVIVLLSFFTCRILIFPFMYWMYGRQFGVPLHRVALHLPLHCNVGNLAILAPQVYWFTLLLKKANRLYQRQRRGKGDGGKNVTKTD